MIARRVRGKVSQSELDDLIERHEFWLSGRSHTICDRLLLTGVNLIGLVFDHHNLARAHICDALLNRTSLRGTNLREANLSGTSFTGADFGNANLEQADMEDCYLGFANLTGSNLHGATMRDASLSGARLDRAHFTHVDARGVDLTGACLRGTFFCEPNQTENTRPTLLINASLVGADLTNAHHLDTVDLSRSDLSGAIIEQSA